MMKFNDDTVNATADILTLVIIITILLILT